jgi:hypothetical protein
VASRLPRCRGRCRRVAPPHPDRLPVAKAGSGRPGFARTLGMRRYLWAESASIRGELQDTLHGFWLRDAADACLCGPGGNPAR